MILFTYIYITQTHIYTQAFEKTMKRGKQTTINNGINKSDMQSIYIAQCVVLLGLNETQIRHIWTGV